MTARMLKGLLGIACILIAVAVVFAEGIVSPSKNTSREAFSSPAAEQAYVCQGDMSRNMTDSQMIAAIKRGKSEESFTRTASCSTSCSVNCTRSCSNCCTHQCGRGY